MWTDVGRVEVGAVVELNALTQLVSPLGGVGVGLPGQRKPRYQIEAIVEIDQRIVDTADQAGRVQRRTLIDGSMLSFSPLSMSWAIVTQWPSANVWLLQARHDGGQRR